MRYNKVKITWKMVPKAQKYVVYQRISGTWKKIKTIKNKCCYVNIKTGINNRFTVEAIEKIDGKTVRSGYDKQGILGKAIPEKAILTGAECLEEGKITLTWKAAAGASGYWIYRKKKNGRWVPVIFVNGGKRTSYNLFSSKENPIRAGTTYTYKICSYQKKGNTYGKESKKEIRIKALSRTGVSEYLASKTARSVLERITSKSMTKSEKLYAAWRYITEGNFYYYIKEYDTSTEDWQWKCAQNFLKTGCGDCYGFATGFAALAKEIGYKPYVVMGRVSGTRDGAADGLTRHGWVQINGKYYDPEAEYAGWYTGVYGYGWYDIRHTIQKYILF